MKKRSATYPLLLIFAALFLAVAFSPFGRIYYHRWRFEATHRKIFDNPITHPGGAVSYGDGELFEQQEFHRERLVDLGYLFHARYDFDQLEAIDGAQPVLFELISGKYPGIPMLPWVESWDPMEVWDYADRKPEWDAFYKRHNTPAFAEENAELLEQVRKRHRNSQ